MHLLLDQNAPLGLRRHLQQHDVKTARYLGWQDKSNGDLIALAEINGCDVLITADQNLRYQQNMATRTIAIIVLSTNHWQTISWQLDRLVAAVDACRAGDLLEIAFDEPPPGERRSGGSLPP